MKHRGHSDNGCNGWTSKGLERFDELYEMVYEDRERNGAEFDRKFLAHANRWYPNGKRRKRDKPKKHPLEDCMTEANVRDCIARRKRMRESGELAVITVFGCD